MRRVPRKKQTSKEGSELVRTSGSQPQKTALDTTRNTADLLPRFSYLEKEIIIIELNCLKPEKFRFIERLKKVEMRSFILDIPLLRSRSSGSFLIKQYPRPTAISMLQFSLQAHPEFLLRPSLLHGKFSRCLGLEQAAYVAKLRLNNLWLLLLEIERFVFTEKMPGMEPNLHNSLRTFVLVRGCKNARNTCLKIGN